jgi:hypothetical protein
MTQANYERVPAEVARENAAGLAKVRAAIDAGPYEDTWQSLAAFGCTHRFRATGRGSTTTHGRSRT